MAATPIAIPSPDSAARTRRVRKPTLATRARSESRKRGGTGATEADAFTRGSRPRTRPGPNWRERRLGGHSGTISTAAVTLRIPADWHAVVAKTPNCNPERLIAASSAPLHMSQTGDLARRAAQTAAKSAGLNPKGVPPLGLHDLRHSAAGLTFAALPLNEVPRLLRHANPRVSVRGSTLDRGVQRQGDAGCSVAR